MKFIIMVRELAAPDPISGVGGLVLGAAGPVQEPLLVGLLPSGVRGSAVRWPGGFAAPSLPAAQADVRVDG